MKYRDRQGREYEQTTSQDSFLAAAYSSAMGRALMKFLGCPIFSKCARVILDSKFSVPFIYIIVWDDTPYVLFFHTPVRQKHFPFR